MTLSKNQLDVKDKFMKYLWLHERDLLQCAKMFPAWRERARELGFTDAKIDAPWPHLDEGRLIKYADLPFENAANYIQRK